MCAGDSYCYQLAVFFSTQLTITASFSATFSFAGMVTSFFRVPAITVHQRDIRINIVPEKAHDHPCMTDQRQQISPAIATSICRNSPHNRTICKSTVITGKGKWVIRHSSACIQYPYIPAGLPCISVINFCFYFLP